MFIQIASVNGCHCIESGRSEIFNSMMSCILNYNDDINDNGVNKLIFITISYTILLYVNNDNSFLLLLGMK